MVAFGLKSTFAVPGINYNVVCSCYIWKRTLEIFYNWVINGNTGESAKEFTSITLVISVEEIVKFRGFAWKWVWIKEFTVSWWIWNCILVLEDLSKINKSFGFNKLAGTFLRWLAPFNDIVIKSA
jgi:hypothetical protein